MEANTLPIQNDAIAEQADRWTRNDPVIRKWFSHFLADHVWHAIELSVVTGPTGVSKPTSEELRSSIRKAAQAGSASNFRGQIEHMYAFCSNDVWPHLNQAEEVRQCLLESDRESRFVLSVQTVAAPPLQETLSEPEVHAELRDYFSEKISFAFDHWPHQRRVAQEIFRDPTERIVFRRSPWGNLAALRHYMNNLYVITPGEGTFFAGQILSALWTTSQDGCMRVEELGVEPTQRKPIIQTVLRKNGVVELSKELRGLMENDRYKARTSYRNAVKNIRRSSFAMGSLKQLWTEAVNRDCPSFFDQELEIALSKFAVACEHAQTQRRVKNGELDGSYQFQKRKHGSITARIRDIIVMNNFDLVTMDEKVEANIIAETLGMDPNKDFNHLEKIKAISRRVRRELDLVNRKELDSPITM